jgi:Tol biopolymer transport system component
MKIILKDIELYGYYNNSINDFATMKLMSYFKAWRTIDILDDVAVKSLIEKDKQISLLIFRSGSIIITGAKNSTDISNCYLFITKVISSNSKKLFYYDINEELKQKKKKKKVN